MFPDELIRTNSISFLMDAHCTHTHKMYVFSYRFMHGRLTKTEENGAVDSLEMPVPTASGGRTRRTGLLTVMERPPGE